MIKLVFVGRPISKDNEKICNKKGRFFLSQKFRDYETEIKKEFLKQKDNDFKIFTKDVIMTMRVFFEDGRCLDLQNVPKSICDALTGFLYENDKQICELHLFKEFDKLLPRIEITATEKI